MLHALDARTGVEVWAFIPFNLLPKLRALRYGQSLDAFKYFVDSSPKISDVKVGGEWRTYLFFGQGPGGTFYNTLDVTLDDIGGRGRRRSRPTPARLLLVLRRRPTASRGSGASRATRVFDAHASRPYGELSRAGASAAEKTVGETWSDPAIGQVAGRDGPYVMVVGSGFLKYSVQTAANRSGVTRAGTTFYVLDVADGRCPRHAA